MFGKKEKKIKIVHEPDVTRGDLRFRRGDGDRVTVWFSNPDRPDDPDLDIHLGTVRDDRPIDRVADDWAAAEESQRRRRR
ncbi:hypothetical protein FDG2_6335 [Candidatus Protofrankia californiensis]|uniref:Uncharacterized protein n=1 Tax=Candidatus Protofrankia californiensis TaxID=1839754 RepID=A0A1C3PGQ2_9ACTN|nr:hypothetical protein FDG2_6335 [Candidatus Protofrankia californiensis]